MQSAQEPDLDGASVVPSRPIDGAALETARDEAFAAWQALTAIAWPPGGDPATPGTHQHFARLYYQTTKHWLRDLDTKREGALGYLAIKHFYARYDACVSQVLRGETRETAPHWRPYFTVAHRITAPANALQAWQLIYFGLLAHTGPDLTDAIRLAWTEYRDIRGRAPDHGTFQTIILGPHTDRLFLMAAIDYLEAERRAGGVTAGPLALNGARLLQSLWIAAFQKRRHDAWTEARRCIGNTASADPSVH